MPLGATLSKCTSVCWPTITARREFISPTNESPPINVIVVSVTPSIVNVPLLLAEPVMTNAMPILKFWSRKLVPPVAVIVSGSVSANVSVI